MALSKSAKNCCPILFLTCVYRFFWWWNPSSTVPRLFNPFNNPWFQPETPEANCGRWWWLASRWIDLIWNQNWNWTWYQNNWWIDVEKVVKVDPFFGHPVIGLEDCLLFSLFFFGGAGGSVQIPNLGMRLDGERALSWFQSFLFRFTIIIFFSNQNSCTHIKQCISMNYFWGRMGMDPQHGFIFTASPWHVFCCHAGTQFNANFEEETVGCRRFSGVVKLQEKLERMKTHTVDGSEILLTSWYGSLSFYWQVLYITGGVIVFVFVPLLGCGTPSKWPKCHKCFINWKKYAIPAWIHNAQQNVCALLVVRYTSSYTSSRWFR